MTVLITGAAGFIGSNLVEKILSQGHKVIAVDNFITGQKSNLLPFLSSPQFEFYEHDVIESYDFGPVDQIYNLACPASPSKYAIDPIHTLRTSFEGNLNALKLAKKYKATMLYTSTSEVYGDPQVWPQNEEYFGNVNPNGLRSCYDEGKRAGESLVMNYWRQTGLPVKIVRIFNTYGPNMDPEDGRVVSNFINQALKNQNFTIYGDGSQTRSFQYIDDLIEALILTMNSDSKITGPINLGNPGEFTVKELADIIVEMIPETKSKFEFLPLPPDDPKTRKPDITLAENLLGWKPKIELRDGLKKTIKYFSEIMNK